MISNMATYERTPEYAGMIPGLTWGVGVWEEAADGTWWQVSKLGTLRQAVAEASSSPARDGAQRKILIQPSGFAKPHFDELTILFDAVNGKRWGWDEIRAESQIWPDWAKPAAEAIKRNTYNELGIVVALELAECWARTRC